MTDSAATTTSVFEQLHDYLFPKYRNDSGVIVQAVQVHTASDLIALRSTEWHDGQLRVLTFPTADPQGWVGPEGDNFTAFSGKAIDFGNYVVKGPAGDIEVWTETDFEAAFTAVTAL